MALSSSARTSIAEILSGGTVTYPIEITTLRGRNTSGMYTVDASAANAFEPATQGVVRTQDDLSVKVTSGNSFNVLELLNVNNDVIDSYTLPQAISPSGDVIEIDVSITKWDINISSS